MQLDAGGSTTRLRADELFVLCKGILSSAGVPEEDAAIVADSLVVADLRGVRSHGVARLPAYIRRIEAGLLTPVTRVQVIAEREATALVDAGNGFGQVAASHAMSLALEKAGRVGLAAVGVRNSNHFGAAAYFAMKALAHNAIGIVCSNSAPAMAPWGGTLAMLGTNPLAVAIPAGTEKPVVLDMAASSVARGKIRLAAASGTPIPLGWATDREGRPTQDAAKALEGLVLPMAGPKGYGLALVIDVLCGVLLGSAFGKSVGALDDLSSGPTRAGHFFGALAIEAFMEPEEFGMMFDLYIREIRASPRSPACERIYLPGEIEWEAEEKARREDIVLERHVVQALLTLHRRYCGSG